MSTSDPKHLRCCSCNIILWRSSGPRMELNTQLQADDMSEILGKQFCVGDILCNRCRRSSYEKGFKKTTKQNTNISTPDVLHVSDPTFHVVENRPVETSSEIIEIPFSRVVSTHAYCFLCRSSAKLIIVPFETRQQVFSKKRVFIPKGNRCCPKHLIKNRLFDDELQHIRIHSTTSSIEIEDLRHFLEDLSIRSESTILDKIGDYRLSEERVRVLTGLNWENIIELREMMTSMRNSASRNVTQAIVIFLFKLRTGNSNKTIASVLGLEREQQVSECSFSIIQSFEKDILPIHFGFHALVREQLIKDQTSMMAKKLYDVEDKLALIFDGTYVHHEKSTNNEYQRRSYSGQKKKPLCKPFTIVTTNGYIVETLGPFSANLNDATIMEEILLDPHGLKNLMKPGDICIVDRGFRDVKDKLCQLGYSVLMPALKGQRKQLTTSESNDSRLVTKIRWVIEAVHGILGEKYHLLHQQVDNKLLPKVRSYCRIASFLNNKFGKRLDSDVENCDQIVGHMKSKKNVENSLAQEVENEHWRTRKVPFKPLSSSDILDFPEMTKNDLKILFTGSYQLKQAVSYLAELIDDDNNISMKCVKEKENIIKIEVRSRHMRSKTYKCFIDYKSNSVGYSGIRRHYCECANGNRTVGCCSHVAAVIYFLSHARYLSKIVRPAEVLSELFKTDNITAVINENSDDD